MIHVADEDYTEGQHYTRGQVYCCLTEVRVAQAKLRLNDIRIGDVSQPGRIGCRRRA